MTRGSRIAAFVLQAVLAGAAGAILAGAAVAAQDSNAASAPRQPIAFSHKVHAGTVKLPCKACHPNPDPGDEMTIAPASTCMKCHSAIKVDSPEIQKLAGFAKSGSPVPWVRVYEIPSFVTFSHKLHTSKGNTCQECHGEVATRDQLFRETNISMAGCMDCHKAKKASVDCGACHDIQN
jgi:Cytochrome c7 and related cytochrome c/Class III cytochrome C family